MTSVTVRDTARSAPPERPGLRLPGCPEQGTPSAPIKPRARRRSPKEVTSEGWMILNLNPKLDGRGNQLAIGAGGEN